LALALVLGSLRLLAAFARFACLLRALVLCALLVPSLRSAIGASIGLQMTDMILFFMTEDALKGFSAGSMTVGANGSLAAGPLGREGEAMIGTGVKNGIMAFSSTKGLYGGVSIEFSGVLVDKTANQVQYGQPVSSEDILDKQAPPQGEVFDRAYKALKEMETMPAAAAPEMAAQPAAAQPSAGMTKA
jgi:lipid-binding SYLF domain-containing protein